MSPSCLIFKRSNKTQFCAVTHFQQSPGKGAGDQGFFLSSRSFFFFECVCGLSVLCVLVPLNSILTGEELRKESLSHRETHSLQRHVPRLSFFRVCQPHCHEDAVDQDGQQDEETKQSVSVKEKLSDALKQFFTCNYDTGGMEKSYKLTK